MFQLRVGLGRLDGVHGVDPALVVTVWWLLRTYNIPTDTSGEAHCMGGWESQGTGYGV